MASSSWLRNWKHSLERRWALYQAIRRKSIVRRRDTRLRLEALEDRTLLSTNTYLVNLAGDAGASTGALSGDIRYCITQADQPANAGSTITFDTKAIGSNTITLSKGELAISDNMTIQGPSASSLTISGGNSSRIFDITSTTAVVTISGFTISDGSAPIDSDGIYIGGGIYNSGSLTVSDSALSDNSANTSGGGIYNRGSLLVKRCTLAGNSAASGGGIASLFGGNAMVSDSTLFSNSATVSGGGIASTDANVTVSDSTLSGNSSLYGGGIETGINGETTVSDSTLSDNSATYGGGIECAFGNVLLHNTLIAGNLNGGKPSDISGTLENSSDYNLIGDGSGGLSAANHNVLGSSASPINPLLAPLGNYGGPTQTLALLPGSPAIDAGSSTYGGSTDQRGMERVGAPDIGAFESQGSTLAVSSGNNQNAFPNTAFADPLVVSATPNNPLEPVVGGRVTFTAPASGVSAILSGSPATIGSDGKVSVTATANSAPGAYVVTASASGVASPANFSLNNASIVYTVTSTADDGSAGTLRDAINQVNTGKYNEIDFNIGTSGSAQTINLASQLPTLTASGVYINGLSQGGSGNTTQLITLNGTNAGSSSDGLLLTGSNCMVSGLIVESFNNGIEVDGSNSIIGGTATGAGNIVSGNRNDGVLIDSGISGVQVQGNFIGTNTAGNSALGNGVGIEVAGSNNTIGGTASGARNIISGNVQNGLLFSGDSVVIDTNATGVAVQGNYIGTDVTGTKAVPDGYDCIDVEGSNATIGGTTSGARNVITGGVDGLRIGGSGVLVQGNYIGTDVTGTNSLIYFDGYAVQAGGPDCTIGGTVTGARNILSSSEAGVAVYNTGVTVQGNYIGTDVTGTKSLWNYDGIDAGSDTVIGGTTSGAGNIISGNYEYGVGVSLGSTGVTVQGNYIGTDVTGTKALPNSVGIGVGGSNFTIGGTTTGAGNIISGNTNDGVAIYSNASNVQVQGNYIGTDVTGANPLGNSGNGVEIAGNNNTVGGTATGAGNIISANSMNGVLVSAGSGNSISQNSIFANSGLGISLASSANNNIVAPTLSSDTLTGTTLTAHGSFTAATANVNYVLEFFANPSSDAEGKVYLGSLTVTPTSTGTQSFTFTTTTTVTGTYPLITATLTDNSGDTSAFSETTYVVTSTADDGSAGTLRDAINQVNAGKYREIDFNITGTGLQTINLTSALPALTASGIFINGQSENQFQGVTGASPLIELNGSGAGSSSDGLLLQGSSCIVSGLLIEDFNNGIKVDGSTNTIGGTTAGAGNILSGNTTDGMLIDSGISSVVVQGNYIGTNAAGNAALANRVGIEVAGSNNTIGGTSSGVLNVISGNSNDGVLIDSGVSGVQVQGNYIGTDATAAKGIGNGVGISASNSNNTIGGTAAGAGNVISGNTSEGMQISASGVTVQGNYIGTDVTGTQAVANGIGILVSASHNTIGGTAAGANNVISGNSGDGVQIASGVSGVLLLGNYIGTDLTGNKAVANSIGVECAGSNNTIGGPSGSSRNLISGNGHDGVLIDSGVSGVLVQGNFIGTNPGGTAAVGNGIGIEVAGSHNTIGASYAAASNLISGNSGDGVKLDGGSSGNQVLGSYIGTNLAGTTALANNVGIEDAGSSNTIGGTTSGARNLISGNSADGVLIDSTATAETMLGNFIGTNITASTAVANGSNGVEIEGTGNTIGGNSAANVYTRNYISGNDGDGVKIDSSASGNQVLGNFLGVGIYGTDRLANVNGIEIAGSSNTIGAIGGGATRGLGDVISGNSKDGVLIDSNSSGNQVLGNFIGTDYSGRIAVANSSNGIEIQGTGNTVGGSLASGSLNRISGNSNDGVKIDSGASGNMVEGNAIGVNIYDSAVLGNSGNGIEVAGDGNTIGASWAVAPNEISGNKGDGVKLDQGSSGNQVLGNYIGTNHAGTAALANSIGIEDGGSGNTLGGSILGAKNVISGNSGDGILLDSTATGETVQGSYIGVNVGGNTILANGTNGVEVKGNKNTIGGNSGSNYFTRNFISGNNKDGVLIDSGASGNQVVGNFIGIGVSGTNGVGNVANAIEIAGSTNTVGGTVWGNRNVLSASGNDGVLLDSTATNNLLQGNYVGTDYTGKNAVANSGNGIEIQGTGNMVGGSVSGAGNVISDNTKDGVLVSGGSGNTLSRNSIFANTGLGISLGSSANNNIAVPSISSAMITGSTLTVRGSFMAATANVSYVLEFFANPTGDAEGKIYLGALTVKPTSTGTQSFTFTTTTSVTGTSPLITATLTDSSGDTSEFSPGIPV